MPSFNYRITLVVGLVDQEGNRLDRDLVIREMVKPMLDRSAYSGASVIDQQGYWEGTLEHSLRVEICAYSSSAFGAENEARDMAAYLAHRARQECVLWTVDEISGGLVNALHEEV